MYDYVWILNIPSEVTGAFPRFDLTNLPPSRKGIFSSSEQSKDQGVTIITCSNFGDIHNLVFNVDNGQSTRKVSVDVMAADSVVSTSNLVTISMMRSGVISCLQYPR